MRKTILISLVAFLFVYAICGLSYAAVSGPCSGCHTMHNSQNGTEVTDACDPACESLLLNTCLGCHTTDGTDPYVNGYPYVKSTGDSFNDDNCLAGGFFQVVDDTTGNNADMAHSLGNQNAPAGLAVAENAWYTGTTNGLSCAGTDGCHGNETDSSDMEAISGGHHSPSVYRILYVGTNGVLGTGASDYEEALINNPTGTPPHNFYDSSVTTRSISALCGKCHSDFHGSDDTNASSPFIRHPTDVAIPASWEIYSEFATEWTSNPIAWKNHPLGFNATESAVNSRVTCVSCHRAHGTENNDLLRWDYALMEAGTTTVNYGCLGCHSKQRG